MKKTERITMEQHNTEMLQRLHLIEDKELYDLLREYQSYNTGLGAYDQMIEAVQNEMLKRK